jgi:hypothetical protein
VELTCGPLFSVEQAAVAVSRTVTANAKHGEARLGVQFAGSGVPVHDAQPIGGRAATRTGLG